MKIMRGIKTIDANGFANEVAALSGILPAISGASEKQIKYAESCRAKTIKNLQNSSDRVRIQENHSELYAVILNRLANCASASFWIENQIGPEGFGEINDAIGGSENPVLENCNFPLIEIVLGGKYYTDGFKETT